MPRLPQPGGDAGNWGAILNDYLSVEHNADGTLKNAARPADLNSKYTKPGSGIPKTDLEQSVQDTLTTVATHTTDIAAKANQTDLTATNTRIDTSLKPDGTLKDGSVTRGALDASVAAAVTTLVPQGVTDEAPAINTALAATPPVGQVRMVTLVGSFFLSQPLVVRSDTILDISRAALALNPGSNCHIIQSQATYGTGRDRNITIRGSRATIIDRGSGNTGTGNNIHSIVMRKVDGLTISGITYRSASGKYGVLVQHVTNVLIEDIVADNCNSDGVHIQGPASNVIVRRISGTSGDDLVGITPVDYTTYVWGDEGDVTDVVIEDIAPKNGHAAGVKVLGGQGCQVRRISISRVSGTVVQYPVWIGGDPLNAALNGPIDDVRVVDLTAQSASPGYTSLRLNGAAIGSVAVDGHVVATGSNNSPGVQIEPGAVVSKLAIQRVSLVSGTAEYISVLGTVKRCVVTGVSGVVPAGQSIVRYPTSATSARIDSLAIRDGSWSHATVSGSIVRLEIASQTLGLLTLSDLDVTAPPAWIADLNASTDLYLSNVRIASGGNIANLRAAANLKVYANQPMPSGTTAVTAGGVVRSRGLGYQVDVSKLTKAAGDMATNTNAALSCGVGPVICDGTTWKHLYTGATY